MLFVATHQLKISNMQKIESNDQIKSITPGDAIYFKEGDEVEAYRVAMINSRGILITELAETGKVQMFGIENLIRNTWFL